MEERLRNSRFPDNLIKDLQRRPDNFPASFFIGAKLPSAVVFRTFAIMYNQVTRQSSVFILLLILLSCTVTAQVRNCVTDSVHRYKLLNIPGYRENFENASNSISFNEHKVMSADTTVVIPVVVHVIGYNGVYPVSEEQIQSQIDVLNEDYALLNATSLDIPAIWQPLSKDSKIRFQLAQRDPAGLNSNGVTWSMGSKTEYDIFDPDIYETDSGGYDAWPRSDYLNMWVCKLSGNALGYANYPGSAPANDGVVVSPRAFGRYGSSTSPYDLGRTATHEVGHWLSLIHIWGDDPASSPCSGKDFTGTQTSWDDTPNQGQPTYRCKVFPALDDCATSSPGYMYQNYMDYTDDKCMMLFTSGQIRKCRTVLDGLRDSIKLSYGAVAPFHYNHDVSIDSVLSPVKSVNDKCIIPTVRLKNYGNDTVHHVTIVYGLYAQLTKKYYWEGTLYPDSSIVISLTEIGINSGNQVMEFRLAESDDRSINNYRSSGFAVMGSSVSSCRNQSMIAFPNPITNSQEVCIKTSRVESQKSVVELFNNLGQRLSTTELMINPGDAFLVNLSKYPSGCYHIRVTGDVYTDSIKIIYISGDGNSSAPVNCN